MRTRYFLLGGVLLLGHLASAQEVKIDFHIKDIPDSVVYIGYHFGNQKYVQDTLQVQGDAFTFSAAEAKEGLYFVYTPDYYIEFVLMPGSYALKSSYEGGYDDLQVKNSQENELFKTFQLKLGALQKEQRTLMDDLKGGVAEDSASAVERLNEIDVEMDAFRKQMAADYPGSFTVSFLQLMEDVEIPSFDSVANEDDRKKMRYFYYKEHFFDGVDLKDKRLLRTPLIHPKVMKYFDQLVSQNPDSINVALDWFFDRVGDDPESFRYWLVTFFKKYTESKIMGMDKVTIHLIENYYLTDRADWLTDDYEKKLREEVAYVKPNLIGNDAPPLNVVDTLMQPFFLRQVQSPYTLLFIYDPDCGHCKKTIKELEKDDEALSAQNIQVVAVCTTTDVERWKKFVAEANPQWLHAIDPTGKSYFRVSYNVRSTPKLYLLDADKKIIGKQLEADQIIDLAKRMSAE